MGLLSDGSPLSWIDTRKYANYVKRNGVQQFLNIYRKLHKRTKDVLYWGDEVEYQLVKFDHVNRQVSLSLHTQHVLKKLNDLSANSTRFVLNDMMRNGVVVSGCMDVYEVKSLEEGETRSAWHHEYAEYMVEGTPGRPYGGLMAHFNIVEANMRRRRNKINEALGASDDIVPLSITVFPRLGVGSFTDPVYKPDPTNGESRSIFFPDQAVNSGHPRFRTLTRNIRERRGAKVCINVPVFKDVNTKSPFTEDFGELDDVDQEAFNSCLPDHIYMDCMGFGMGCCCLQVTFQACNITEARHLYDQLAPICPIMVLQDGEQLISKSRYDSINSYLSECGGIYNDIPIAVDRDAYDTLLAEGVDALLARHIAHLFIRDPISLFSEKLVLDNEVDDDHFENIQSTNWQTMRFKPPPSGQDIGWRVEFRPMETQLTDFENAAYTVFIVLLTRVILSFKLNFLLPISKVDENMQTAFRRNGVLEGHFYFRKDVLTDCSPPEASKCSAVCSRDGRCTGLEDEYRMMTCNEIINGSDDFVGLMSLMKSYLRSVECDVDTCCTVEQYLSLISKRASGELMTTSRWIRHEVAHHPHYKRDSVISEDIAYDLLVKFAKVSQEEDEPSLLSSHRTLTNDIVPSAVAKGELLLKDRTTKLKPSASPATDRLSANYAGLLDSDGL